MRTTIALAASAAALVLLTGCMPAGPAASPTPTPAAPTTPTADASSAPPSVTASATPTATAGAADDDDEHRYCGDEFVLARLSGGSAGWAGTPEEQLVLAEPQPVFAPADALDGLDVECVATFRRPTDGSDIIAVVSEAVLERDDEAEPALEAWAAANGYTADPGATGYVERAAPPQADGTSTRKIFWAPLDGDEPTIGDADEIVRLSGADTDALYVWHVDFTQG